MGMPARNLHARTMTRVDRKVIFDQDRLVAYNLGRAFAREIETLLKRIPRGHTDQFDQLRRAALSITLNTAEGAGEFKSKEKSRFYRIARRSGTEAAAVLDSIVDRALLKEADIEPARAILHRATGALTRLIQSCEGTPNRNPPLPPPARTPTPKPASAPDP